MTFSAAWRGGLPWANGVRKSARFPSPARARSHSRRSSSLGFWRGGQVGTRLAVMAQVIAVLVIIVRVVVRVLPVEVDVVEHHAQDVNAGVLDALHCLARVVAADFVEFGHENEPVRKRGNDQRIAQDRKSVV